jgi:hypothetical protein
VERAAAITRPAVVYLEISWRGWVRDQRDGLLWLTESTDLTTSCTGFVVGPQGHIVTAGHCVDPGIEGVAPSFFEDIIQRTPEAGVQQPTYTELAEHSVVEGEAAGTPPDREIFVQRGAATSGLQTGEAFPARLVAFNPLSEGDVALLKVEESNMSSVMLAPRDEIEIGMSIVSIGYPGSAESVSDATFEPTNKDGKISAKRTSGGVPFYEMSAAMTQGMSGGPVVDDAGRVVGLNSFYPAGETQAFNFMAPSSIIAELLAKNGVRNELGRLDRLHREGLDLYWAGNYTGAVQRFDAVLDVTPSHQQAQEFRQKATERKARFGDYVAPSSSNAGRVALLVLLVVGGLGGAFFLGRRRTRAPTEAGGPVPESVAHGEVAEAPPGITITSAPPVDVSPSPIPELAQIGGPAAGPPNGTRTSPTLGQCPSCGAELRSLTAFCVRCGKPTGGGTQEGRAPTT